MSIMNFYNDKTIDNQNFGNKRMIRLVYVDMAIYKAKIGYTKKFGSVSTSSMEEAQVGQHYYISNPYRLPYGMSIEDACKIVSYLSDQNEKNNDIRPAGYSSVATVDEQLSSYGLVEVKPSTPRKKNKSETSGYNEEIGIVLSGCPEMPGVVDLFTVEDKILFSKSRMADRYFEWFTPNVTGREILKIMSRCDIEPDYDDPSNEL